MTRLVVIINGSVGATRALRAMIEANGYGWLHPSPTVWLVTSAVPVDAATLRDALMVADRHATVLVFPSNATGWAISVPPAWAGWFDTDWT